MERELRSSTKTMNDYRAFTRICSPQSANLTSTNNRRKTAGMRTSQNKQSGAFTFKNIENANYNKSYGKSHKLKP
tara:strand:+ start:805 stop:1029 length:225 start_codon:yes stop_codon:yes gene_type:complete